MTGLPDLTGMTYWPE